MIKLEQIKMPITFSEFDIKKACAKQLKIKENQIKNFQILKQSLDARRKPDVFYVLCVAIELEGDLENRFKDLKYSIDTSTFEYKKITTKYRPVVVGFGPAGMFCALMLSRMGLRPVVLEQGKSVDEREKDVQNFWRTGELNKHSNVQFGEGGAGTFSDGKLNTNLNNEYCKKVIRELHNQGAPKQILYISKPHIGSDNLKNVVKNIRNEIIENGGEVLFSHKLEDIEVENNQLKTIKVLNIETNEYYNLKTNRLILCVGHSARDCFEMLYKKNVEIHQKPFAMGVRIEQDQHKINQSQYGENYDKNLPNADYKLVVHLGNRSVFTFCMCPGGEVVASSSNEGEIVTNGMSYFARDKLNANCAVLVNVVPEDYQSSHPLAGIYFQQKYEKLAYQLGGGNFCAPYTTVGEFLGKKVADEIDCSYRPNVKKSDISKCLPDFVSESLKKALPEFNKKLKNFALDENVLIAIESRSSCPLTILRDANFESNIKGIYPCGEGAGYAGGIISSAIDGVKVAEAIYDELV